MARRTMQEMREWRGALQRDLATEMGIGRSRISYLETGRSAPSIDTLRRYVEGLGGELVVMARFGDGTFTTLDV